MAHEQADIPMETTEATAEQRMAALAMLPRRFGRRDSAGAEAVLGFVLAGRSDEERVRRNRALSLAFGDDEVAGLDEALAEAERFIVYAEAPTVPAARFAARGKAG